MEGLALKHFFNNNFNHFHTGKKLELWDTFKRFSALVAKIQQSHMLVEHFKSYVKYIQEDIGIRTDPDCLYFDRWHCFQQLLHISDKEETDQATNSITLVDDTPQHTSRENFENTTTPFENTIAPLENLENIDQLINIAMMTTDEISFAPTTTTVLESSDPSDASTSTNENNVEKPKAKVKPQKKRPGRPRKSSNQKQMSHRGKNIENLKREHEKEILNSSKKMREIYPELIIRTDEWCNRVDLCLMNENNEIKESTSVICDRAPIHTFSKDVYDRVKYLTEKTQQTFSQMRTAHTSWQNHLEEFNYMRDILNEYIDKIV